MNRLIESISINSKLIIKNEEYIVKSKTWYSIEEDDKVLYIKSELSKGKTLVIIPDDNLIYIGNVVDNMNYIRLNDSQIKYNNNIYCKTGDGHQYIKKVEFGDIEKIEGRCIFEDYESNNNIISLGILTEKNNMKADVLAEIIRLNDIKVV